MSDAGDPPRDEARSRAAVAASPESGAERTPTTRTSATRRAPLPSSRWGTRLVALGAGLVSYFAYPDFDLWPLLPIALAPWLAVLERASRYRDVVLLGVLYGLGLLAPLLVWITPLTVLGYVLLVVVLAGWFGAGAALGLALRRAGLPAVLAWPVALLLAEWGREVAVFSGLAWGGFGYTQHAGPLLAVAAVGGVYLISVLLTALGTGLALLVWPAGEPTMARRTVPLLGAAGLVVLATAGGLVARPDVAGAQTLAVALVQPNVPEGRAMTAAERDSDLPTRNALALLPSITTSPRLVVFPESSMLGPISTRAVGPEVRAAATAFDAYILVNFNERIDDLRFWNSDVLVAPSGADAGRYDKQKLVPFGEYLPFRRWLSWAPGTELIPRDGVPGPAAGLLDVDGVPVGVLICFESAFAEPPRQAVLDGAEILVLGTNNASYGRSHASAQHVAMSQLRAAETGRVLLHAGISGISAVITPTGRVTSSLPVWVGGVLEYDAPLLTARTPYVVLGPWVVYIALAVATIALVARPLVRFARARRPARDRL